MAVIQKVVKSAEAFYTHRKEIFGKWICGILADAFRDPPKGLDPSFQVVVNIRRKRLTAIRALHGCARFEFLWPQFTRALAFTA